MCCIIIDNSCRYPDTPILGSEKITAAEIEEARDVPMSLPAIDRKPAPPSFFRQCSNIILGRAQHLNTLNGLPSVSVDNVSDIKAMHKHLFDGRISNRKEGIHYGHPVALYHPALATLQYQLETLDSQVKNARVAEADDVAELDGEFIQLEKNLLKASRTYFEKSREHYLKEEERWFKAVEPFFVQILGTVDMVPQKCNEDEYEDEPQGATANTTNQGSRGRSSKGAKIADAAWKRYVVLELKNEVGVGGNATLQASFWYAKSCQILKVRDLTLLSFTLSLIQNIIG